MFLKIIIRIICWFYISRLTIHYFYLDNLNVNSEESIIKKRHLLNFKPQELQTVYYDETGIFNQELLRCLCTYTYFPNEIIEMCRILLFKNYDNKNVNINWNVNLAWKFSTEKPIAEFQTIRLNCCQLHETL